MKKRALSLFLCLAMLLSLFPVAFAAEEVPFTEEELILTAEDAAPAPAEEDGETPSEAAPAEDENPTDVSDEPSDEPAAELEETEPDEPAAEPGTSDEGEKPVRVVFVTDPQDAEVVVYDHEERDENGELLVIEPEEDESYLLMPGKYYYDMQAEGFTALEKVEFEVKAGEKQEIRVFMTAEEPAETPEDPEPTETSEDPEPAETPEDPEPTEESETPEEPAEAVRVVFVTEPEDAVVSVYAPAETEGEEPAVIEAEEDGSFLLLPGAYLYSAAAEGFTALEAVEFTVEAAEEGALEIPVALEAVVPAEPVRVVFVCMPEEADVSVTVYDPAQRNEAGEPAVIEAEEDGSYLLLPGTYLYSAAAEEFTELIAVEFTVEPQEDPEQPMTVEVMLYPAAHVHEDEEVDAIRVVFRCVPEETRVTVFDSLLADETGAPLVYAPEEDGSWLLKPGVYLFSAEFDGCLPIERAPLRVDSSLAVEGEMIVPITMCDLDGNPIVLEDEEAFYLETIGNLGSFPTKISQFRSQFPHGKYWDHYVSSYSQRAWYTGNERYWATVTSSPCSHRNLSGDYATYTYAGYYDCNYFDHGFQCHGFAAMLFYQLYGVRQTSLSRHYSTTGVQVGDFVRLNNDSHAALVIAMSGNQIKLAEANVNNPCMIYWDRWVSTSTITYYIHAPAAQYNAVMGPTQETIDFVKRCYTQILGRSGDADGIRYWSYELFNGTATGASVVNGFVTSPEFINRKLSNASVVEILYKTMLNRSPDASGKADWVALLDIGVSYSYIVNGFANAQEFKNLCASYGINPGSINLTENRDKNINVTSFVNRCYRQILNRAPDANGLNDWCGQLLSGKATGASIVDGFVTSTEFTKRGLSNSSKVEVLYKTMLDRASDTAGRNDWVACLTAGASLRCVVNGFANAPEFKNLCSNYGIKPGTLTNLEWRDRNPGVTKFVYRCYYYALNRNPDTSGLNDWCQKLLQKKLKPAQVAEQFVFSEECLKRNLSNANFVIMCYRLYLGRTPSTSERSEWVDKITAGMTRQQVAAGFAASPEFANIVKSYGL